MKKLLIAFLVASNAYAAETYLVHQFTTHVRIVLSTELKCDTGAGLKASAQRIDKKFVVGCWNTDPTNKDNIRIDWSNGDFSVFASKDFTKVTN